MEVMYSFRSHMGVDLIDSMGDDASVVRAARVSTIGEASTQRHALAASDAGLIRYLMREKHGSPFEHAVFTFYVHAPIFVFRELMRHRIASYNEESARYRQLEPVFYVPSADRRIADGGGKPGHYTLQEGTKAQVEMTSQLLVQSCLTAYRSYQLMIDAGVAREVARMVLPVTTYSSAYMTVNARSLMNVLQLRVDSPEAQYPSHPQYEIEQVAHAMEVVFKAKMPLTYQAFIDNGRVAP